MMNNPINFVTHDVKTIQEVIIAACHHLPPPRDQQHCQSCKNKSSVPYILISWLSVTFSSDSWSAEPKVGVPSDVGPKIHVG